MLSASDDEEMKKRRNRKTDNMIVIQVLKTQIHLCLAPFLWKILKHNKFKRSMMSFGGLSGFKLDMFCPLHAGVSNIRGG
jgi:hypothetical protein